MPTISRIPRVVRYMLVALVGGLAIHLALISCRSVENRSDGGSRDAQAQTSSCEAWQTTVYFTTQKLSTTQAGLNTIVDVPAGWEPMSILPYAEGLVIPVRKCSN
jgi:hypothetical protein